VSTTTTLSFTASFSYDFLLGVGLCWLPSLIVGYLMSFLWPLVAAHVLVLIGSLLRKGTAVSANREFGRISRAPSRG
jgi:hypothetical protein